MQRSLALLALMTLTTALPSQIRRSTTAGVGHGITSDPAALSNRTFDYVICGGGLTGLTVASRLSENPDINVLVIEAGYDNHTSPLVNDVRTYGQAFYTDLDYKLYSTPVSWQNDSQLHLVAGKMLSGSDSLNGASWTKGAKSQYDLLPTLTGDESWGWNNFNEYMLKAEHFHEPTTSQRDIKGAHFDSLDHGYTGPLQVSFGSGMFGGTQAPALEASEKLWQNMSRNSDAASGFVNGATIIPNMVDVEQSQNRSSAFTAYTQVQVQERSNWVILTGHRVTEIVWQEPVTNGSTLVAEGVHFQSSPSSPLNFVKAKREVLLAAGSLQSPQILELSGVGDPAVLSAAGVDVRLPLKGVGKNLQEQTKNTLTYTPKNGTNFNGTGPSTAVTFLTAQQLLGSNTTAWYDSIKANITEYAASLESAGLVVNGTATATILQAQLDNLFYAPDSSAAEIFFTITPDKNEVGIDLWNLIVFSRGTAHIRSKSSWDTPVINPKYFLNPLDLAFQTAAAQQSREVFATEPLSTFVTAETVPNTTVVPANAGQDQWESWVKKTFTSVWHYIATCSMMKQELGGVVNSDLQVYGIKNVRVVDASVVPVQLSAHLSSSLFGIGEKVAESIKGTW